MPPDVLALISKIKNFDFSQNPLVNMPYGFFLFPIESSETEVSNTISEILQTLIELPVWLAEPCTPFMWYLHLKNR